MGERTRGKGGKEQERRKMGKQGEEARWVKLSFPALAREAVTLTPGVVAQAKLFPTSRAQYGTVHSAVSKHKQRK